jgi:uncharacterized membrane protein
MTQQTQQVTVLVAVYPTEVDADAVKGQIEQMAGEGYLDLGDVAVVWKDDGGKVHVNDFAKEHTKGWGTGAIVGGIVGLIFPPSLIAGAAVGAGAGGLYHHFRDKGMSNKELAQAGEELSPGQYGLIAIVSDRFVDEVTQGLAGYEKLGKYLLNADTGAMVSAS